MSRRQAAEVGLGPNAVAHRVARGMWVPVGRRVLRAAGAPVTDRQRAMAAVLEAGDGAVASHETAAALWMLPGFSFGELHVIRPRRDDHRAGAHRPKLVLPHHVTAVQGIPVTTLPRTIFDLAGRGLGLPRLTRLVSTVVGRSPAMGPALHATLDELACRGRSGIADMRAVLADLPEGVVPPTGLERRFEQLLRNAGERPLTRQVDAGGHSWIGRVDYLDEALLLVVEIDSELHHTSPADRARDAARDEQLLAAGYREVLRIPEEWVWWEPWRVAPAVRAARRRCAGAAAA